MRSPQQLLINLGKKIKAVRHFRNMTQQQLANQLHCDRTIISKIENGKKDPGVLIYAIAYALKCDANTFDPYQANTLIIPKTLEELHVNP